MHPPHNAGMHVTVITGASEGIGAEMARQLAASRGPQGAVALVLAARRAEALDAVARDCRALGAETLAVPTDVSRPEDCRALIARTLAAFGRIDTLINNAGVSGHARFADVAERDLGWYEEMMRINLWGSVWCTHAALPALRASTGRLAAVSSLAGLVGVPGRTAYSASKFAQTGFFEALRAELLGTGVSVTLVFPGVVATRIRQRGYNAKGQAAGVSALKEEAAMEVATCARIALHAIARRERNCVMTAQGKASRWAKLIAPAWVDRLAARAVKPGF